MKLVFLNFLLLTCLVLVKAQSLLENFECSLKTDKAIYLITSSSSRKNSRSVDQTNNNKNYKSSLDNLVSCVGFLNLVVESTNVSALCPNATTALEINKKPAVVHTVVNTSEDLGSGRTKSHLSFCLTSQTFLANLNGSLPAKFTFSYKIEDPENSDCHQICYFPGVLAIPDLPPQLQLAAEAQGQFIKAYQPDADSVIASLEESSVLVNRTSKFNVTCECLKLVVGLKSLNTIFENEVIPMEPFALTSLSLTLVSANVWVAIYQNSSLVDFNRASLFPNSNNVISGFSASGVPVVSNFSVEAKQLVSQLCFDSVRDLYSKAFYWDDWKAGLYAVKVFYNFRGRVTTWGSQPKDVEQTFTVVFHDLVDQAKSLVCRPRTVLDAVPDRVYFWMYVVLIPSNILAYAFVFWYNNFTKRHERLKYVLANNIKKGEVRLPSVSTNQPQQRRAGANDAETSFIGRPIHVPGTNILVNGAEKLVFDAKSVVCLKRLKRSYDEIPTFGEYCKKKMKTVLQIVRSFWNRIAARRGNGNGEN